jgi:hypothetical protein
VLVCGFNVCIGRRPGLLVVFSGLNCLWDNCLHWLNIAYAVLGSETTRGAVLHRSLGRVLILKGTHSLILLMI